MKKYKVRVDAFIDDYHEMVFGFIDVEALTEEHAGIKACADFIEGHSTAYGLRVTAVREVE